MAYEKKPNTGFFGKNKKKQSDKSPDYTGSLLIGEDTMQQLIADKMSGKPVTLYLSGWVNTSNAGEKYIALRCNPPQQGQGQPQGQQRRAAPAAPRPAAADEDIPF